MTDREIMIVLWLILVLGGYILEKMPVLVLGSIFGLWVAYQLYSISGFVTLVLLIVNLYTAYNGLEQWDG
jgi:hypothetical protein